MLVTVSMPNSIRQKAMGQNHHHPITGTMNRSKNGGEILTFRNQAQYPRRFYAS